MSSETLDCGSCDSEFSSWDKLASHQIEEHGWNEDDIILIEEVEPRPEVVENQAEEQNSLLEPLVKNPAESEQLISTIGGEFTTSKKWGIIERMGISLIVAVVVLIMIGAVTFLTFRGIISDSVFAFTLGTLIGYLLSFLEDMRQN